MAQDTIGTVNAVVSEDPNMIRYAIPYKEYIVHLQDQIKTSDSLLHFKESELKKCQDEVRELDKSLSSNSVVPLLTNPYGVFIVGILALLIIVIVNSKHNIKLGKGEISIESSQTSKKDETK